MGCNQRRPWRLCMRAGTPKGPCPCFMIVLRMDVLSQCVPDSLLHRPSQCLVVSL